MHSDTTVLFICTGNIFRSMTAEYALRNALGTDTQIQVHSAGLIEAPHEIVQFVKDYHLQRGVDVSSHIPKQVDHSMLIKASLAVAMDFDHQIRLEELYDVKVPLFSEVATGESTALLDVFEVVPDWLNNETAAREYGNSVMDTIYNGIPEFVRRFPAFLNNP